MTAETPPMTVAEKIAELGLTRVVHFTPAKNLHHIVADGQITSNKVLAEYASEYFDPTDPYRLDDHPDMTCVTFTYPNPFYFDLARKLPQFRRFPDWVCWSRAMSAQLEADAAERLDNVLPLRR